MSLYEQMLAALLSGDLRGLRRMIDNRDTPALVRGEEDRAALIARLGTASHIEGEKQLELF